MRTLTLSALLAIAGCYGTTSGSASVGVHGSAGYVSPDLVYVSPGVQVVADYDEPIFYTDGFYWRYYGNTWYRSSYYNRGWVHVSAPRALLRIERPHAYVRYRPHGYVSRRDRPAVRDHRSPVYRDHQRDNRNAPVQRDNRPSPTDHVRDRRDDNRPSPTDQVRDRRDDNRPSPTDHVRDRRDKDKPNVIDHVRDRDDKRDDKRRNRR